MQFNRFLLDNYLATDDGKEALSFFQNLPKYVATGDPDNKIVKFIDELLLVPQAEMFFDIARNVSEENSFETIAYSNFKEFDEDIANTFDDLITPDNPTYRDIVSFIPNISIYLYAESQQFAFPYLYPVHFFRIQEICETFGIILPPLPQKTKYKEKCKYYLELCKVFYEFRLQHQLTPQEFCVFFYCFSQHFISSPLTDDLPLPLKSYIVGAEPANDHEYLETISSKSITFWQGNTDTKIGDIIFMYERSPFSHISSIWRAISPGYDDPFHFYPGKIWIGRPVSIPPISYDELKADPVWAQKGLVKANMQGVNGRPCSREEYAAILDILVQKNFDISVLPSLPKIINTPDKPLTNERDVEVYLLEPLLKQLGLTEKNWIRQMPVRMGRGIRYYPDYVIYPTTTRGGEKGKFICEAKFRIPGEKQLKEDFYQAKSYALRLESRGLLLASCEGIWLATAKDSYEFEKLQFLAWEEIDNPDIFHSIKIKFDKLLK